MELRLELEEESQNVVGVTAVLGESAVQLQAFAAPRSEGIWDDIRAEIAASITAQGGTADKTSGPLGNELRAQMPSQDPSGRTVFSPMRFVGVDGPRWFLRAVLSGPAAHDDHAASTLLEVVRATVVVRGDEAMAPRELLALRGVGHGPPALFSPDQIGAPVPEDMEDAPAGDRAGTATPRDVLPQLLTCLPGPVAVFAERDALLAVDLRRLRSHLVYLRLQRDLIGKRVVAVQGLLAPAVVRRPVEEVALILSARAELLALGIDLDGFGDDAVVVRGVPAHLRHCVDDADVADLIARIVPWLRMRTRESDASAVERGLLGAIAATRGADPAPRLARRWLAELLDAGATLAEVPGLRRWTPAALLGETAGVPRMAIALGHDDGAAV